MLWWLLQTPVAPPITQSGEGDWWFFEQPPPIWVWITIFAAFVALVFAIPPLIAMTLGHPKVVREYKRNSPQKELIKTYLTISFRNTAITSKWIRRFVRREPVVLGVQLIIRREADGREMANWIPNLTTEVGVAPTRLVTLQASLVSDASVTVAVYNSDLGALACDSEEGGNLTALPPDNYLLWIPSEVGEGFDVRGKRIRVTTDDIYWG